MLVFFYLQQCVNADRKHRYLYWEYQLVNESGKKYNEVVMKRNRKIILVAHCLLNVNAKVLGIAGEKGGSKLIGELIQKGYGIIQLPCIEMAMYGSQRWGIVYEQNDFPAFRDTCRRMLDPIVKQVADFSRHGYEITAVIGMDHSPSCGVHITSSGQWCGEFNAENQYQDKLNSLTAKKGAGVMMEELRKMLQDNDIFPAYFAVDETDVLSYSSILEEL